MHAINEDSIRITLKHRQEQFLAEAARDRLADQARQQRADKMTVRPAWPTLIWLAPARLWGTLAGGRG